MSEPMNIDQALDDIIKSGRGSAGGSFRGRGKRGPTFETRRGSGQMRGSGVKISTTGGGGIVRTIQKGSRRSSSGMDGDSGEKWKHDKFQSDVRPGRRAGARGAPESTGAKIIVANLEFSVNNGDIHDLFSSVGTIKQAMVKFDKNGRSTGQAEVVFANKNDALEAIKKYNGVPLDNRPLKISLSTTHTTEAPLRSDAAGSSGGATAPGKRTVIRSGNRGGGGSGRGRRGGRGSDRPLPSKEDLDAQLEAMASGKGNANGEAKVTQEETAMEDN